MNETTEIVINLNDFDGNFEPFRPFMRMDYPLSLWEKLKTILMIPLLIFRVICIANALIHFWLITKVIQCLEGGDFVYRNLRGVSRSLYNLAPYVMRYGLFCGGFCRINRRKYTSNSDKIPCVMVSNHLSMLDIAFIIAEFGVTSFVARGNLKNTPFFGKWMQQVECLFTEDKDKISAVIVKRQEEYDQDPSVPRLVIFPEGTTSNGSRILPFKTGAFLAMKPVLPIYIKHEWNNFQPSWETIPQTTYWIRMFTQVYNHVEITDLPKFQPGNDDVSPKDFAESVRSTISHHSGISKHESTRETKLRFHKMILAGKLSWVRNYLE